MPELPEVESVRQCLANGRPSLLGRTVQQVQVLRDNVVAGDLNQLCHILQGARCDQIQRHGKYLFFGFYTPHQAVPIWLAVHLRMTGRLYLVPMQEPLPRHARLMLHLDQELALRFDDPRGFGRVWLVDDPTRVTADLGPDALTLDQDLFLEQLHRAKRQLKPLLLDQSFVAGIGNIYADETLFRARLHPERRSDSLAADEKEHLYAALHQVITQAVDLKGANIDGVFEAGQFPVAVYGRQGLPCQVCGAMICKTRVGQRGTHFCPACQCC